MTEVNLREASRAAVHLTKQLKAVLVVGAALEQIENLDNMRDEAVRLQGDESAKLLEIKEKIADAEKDLAAVDFDKDKSLEARANADAEVRAKLEQADFDAQEIRNAAEREANAERAKFKAEALAGMKALEADIEAKEAELRAVLESLDIESAKLDAINNEKAELAAKLS